jgi:hypothetical protein
MHLRGLILPIAAAALFLAVPKVSEANTPFIISWTAPGDDSLSGKATEYELRYSKSMITASNYASATKITGLPVPKPAGSHEMFAVRSWTTRSTTWP